MSKSVYIMRISLNVLDHLGVNLYSDVPPVLAEAVANSWDADATEVDIDIDTEARKITITDNGHGMTLNDMNKKYLTVGYDRRNDDKEQGITRPRRIMGRKGIGKLALFSIADTVEVQSVTGEGKNGFVMSAQEIEKQSRKEQSNREEPTSYHPDSLPDDKITLDEKGTRITLTNLKTRVTKATANALKKRIARRFGIIEFEDDFTVCINGDTVNIDDRDYFHKLQYLWHHGEGSEKYVEFCKKKPDYVEKREGKAKVDEHASYPVTGWIGTTDLPSDLKDGDENLNKIVVMVRGKLAQEDILEDITEGGVYTKYIIGEIHANFLDDDELDDIATSNRQEIIKDDPRYIALRSWVNEELRRIKYKWTKLRNEGAEKDARQISAIDKWMDTLGPDTREKAKAMFGKIAQLPMETEDQRKELYQYSALAFENLAHKDRLSELENLSPANIKELARIFANQVELEAAYYYKTVEQRLSTIKGLERMVEENTIERMIQDYLADNLWLLDPSWEGASDVIYVEQRVTAAFKKINDKLSEDEKRGRIDIRYKKVYGHHVIIELKRPEVKTNDFTLMGQVEKYRTALLKALKQEGDTSESVEIICIVGEELREWTTPNERLRSVRSLNERNIRVILYRELIKEARLIYQEFLKKKQEAGSLCELIKNIEIETPIKSEK